MSKVEQPGKVDHYGAQYGNFDNEVVARVRAEAFGEDIGQNGWLTADEQDLFINWLNLSPGNRLLDVACGAARPTMRIAGKSGCSIVGVDIDSTAIEVARASAEALGLEDRAEFRAVNGEEPVGDSDAAYDAVMCIDAINHLPERLSVLKEWRRVLKPGGRLLYTDPVVITGQITNEELGIRFSIGRFLLTPFGTNEAMLQEAGYRLELVEDRTGNMARNARGWFEARARHEADLRRIEGDDAFAGQQEFFDVAARLAEERRLSRFAFLAVPS